MHYYSSVLAGSNEGISRFVTHVAIPMPCLHSNVLSWLTNKSIVYKKMQQAFNEKIEALLEKGSVQDREIEVGLMCDVEALL